LLEAALAASLAHLLPEEVRLGVQVAPHSRTDAARRGARARGRSLGRRRRALGRRGTPAQRQPGATSAPPQSPCQRHLQSLEAQVTASPICWRRRSFLGRAERAVWLGRGRKARPPRTTRQPGLLQPLQDKIRWGFAPAKIRGRARSMRRSVTSRTVRTGIRPSRCCSLVSRTGHNAAPNHFVHAHMRCPY